MHRVRRDTLQHEKGQSALFTRTSATSENKSVAESTFGRIRLFAERQQAGRGEEEDCTHTS